MRIRTEPGTARPDGDGRSDAAPGARTLRAAALAGALALAACGGGGGPSPGDGPAAGGDSSPAVSRLHLDYALESAGEAPIEADGAVALPCPAAGCATPDLRALAGSGGTRTRGGFGTVTGTTGGPPLKAVAGAASATVSGATFTRHGLWRAHGWAAVETGTGTLSATVDGQAWSGSFRTAHAWADGAASGTNPSGSGGATWRGVAEAADTATFARLPGTAEIRIADLSRPLVDVDVDLDDGGDGVALRWTGMRPAGGGFAKGTAGTDRIDGRFLGPGHAEAWGVFDTESHVGVFGAKRE
ncbi:MAG: hypothetical protein F4Y03_01865 [Alphaproteobacteria bacterium]|nr:hypothetical protein [Alphaproteobacteria bacterium]